MANSGTTGIGRERLAIWSGAVLLGYLGLLVGCYAQGLWFDGPGGFQDADFLNVFAAGRLVLGGNAPAIYDWGIHRQAEVAALGHDFTGYYGWHYPPMLLFAAAPLAALPYLPAWLLWSGATAAGMAWSLWRICRDRAVVLALMAAPATLWCVVVGQNGFLTAGLMGAGLELLERNPVMAGLMLGLLSYKPHFALLLPVALVAGRHWRALASATVTTLVFAGSSALVFGGECWRAFFGSLHTTVTEVLCVGGSAWPKLQSVYALLHQWTGDDRWAWAGHIGLAVGVVGLAMRAKPFRGQAALLVAASVLATPYAYVYDLPLLAVAAAFLCRDGLLRWDGPLLAVAMITPGLFALLGSAAGPVAALVLVGVGGRRGPRLNWRPCKILIRRCNARCERHLRQNILQRP